MPQSWHDATKMGIEMVNPDDLGNEEIEKVRLRRKSDGAECEVFQLSKWGSPNLEFREPDGNLWMTEYALTKTNDPEYGFKIPGRPQKAASTRAGRNQHSEVNCQNDSQPLTQKVALLVVYMQKILDMLAHLPEDLGAAFSRTRDDFKAAMEKSDKGAGS